MSLIPSITKKEITITILKFSAVSSKSQLPFSKTEKPILKFTQKCKGPRINSHIYALGFKQGASQQIVLGCLNIHMQKGKVGSQEQGLLGR
jgi:hypothetical protein